MNPKLPFSLFKKKGKSGNNFWYYSVYDDNNVRHQYSTHTVKKSQAILYCLDLFKNDKLISTTNKPNKNHLLLKNYAKDWFIYDKCPYIKERKMLGFSITQGYALKRRRQFETYILPFFADYLMKDIDKEAIYNWLLYLKDNFSLSNASTNNIIKGLKILLTFAFKKGVIQTDISKGIQLLKNDSRTRGIFTSEEIAKLMDKTKLNEIWHNNLIHYLLNLTASKTGMRRGEIQGLQKMNVFNDHILVENSWDSTFGLKDTKTHKSRIVPISQDLYNELLPLIDIQTNGNFVFSTTKGKTPVKSSSIADFFRDALESIGISKEEQNERFLSFHSYRHYVNTLLVTSGVPINIVQSIIGHIDDDKMTEHYTHISLEDQKTALNFL